MHILKDFIKNTKGMLPHHRVKEFMFYIKCALQRAWRGYDDTDWWSIDRSFVDRHILLLKELRYNSYDSCPLDMTKEEWFELLDNMINMLEDMKEHENDYEKIAAIKDEFFQLFSKYFYVLWD